MIWISGVIGVLLFFILCCVSACHKQLERIRKRLDRLNGPFRSCATAFGKAVCVSSMICSYQGQDAEMLDEKLQKVVDAWWDYVETLGPVYETIKEMCATFKDSLKRLYLEAGAPYGDTDEGMWRWLWEKLEDED